MAAMENIPLPPSPPPTVRPTYSLGLHRTSHEFIRQNMLMYIYVWMCTGQSFWMYPIKIDNNKIYGHIWNEQQWIYMALHLNSIECFA